MSSQTYASRIKASQQQLNFLSFQHDSMMPLLSIQSLSKHSAIRTLNTQLRKLTEEVDLMQNPSFDHLKQIEEDFAQETVILEQLRKRLEESKKRLSVTQEESQQQVTQCRIEINDQMEQQMAAFHASFLSDLADFKNRQELGVRKAMYSILKDKLQHFITAKRLQLSHIIHHLQAELIYTRAQLDFQPTSDYFKYNLSRLQCELSELSDAVTRSYEGGKSGRSVGHHHALLVIKRQMRGLKREANEGSAFLGYVGEVEKLEEVADEVDRKIMVLENEPE